MATQLKFRRGSAATANAFTGAQAELYIDTDTYSIRVHDGSTSGGIATATNSDLNAVRNYAQAAYSKANTGGTITGSVTITGDTTASGNLSIGKDLTVTGNLSVLGNTVSIATSTLEVTDPVILLGIGNYTSDALDIGLAGHYNNGANAHTGVFRDAVAKEWYFFEGYTPEISGNNNIDITNSSFRTSNLNVYRVTGNLVSQSVSIQGVDVRTFQNQTNTAISVIQGVDLGQNTSITAVNNYAAGAYGAANTNATNITAVNNYAAGAYAASNTNSTNISIVQGVDVGQNTRMSIIEAVDVSQNTRMSINEGVDAGQNTRMSIIEAVDLGQNTFITAVQGKMEAAYAAANTKVATVSGTSGRVTSSGTTAITVDLATSGVTASTYGNATALQIPGFTVDTYGRITQANSAAISVVSSAVAGTGISVSGATGAVTITNSGVTALTASTGISVSAGTGSITITNTGATSIVAGTGISVSGATGAVTVTNGGVTSAVAGTGVSVSGATGAVTFSIGQSVATSANFQVNSLGVGTAGSATTGEIRATNNITAYYSDRRLKDIQGVIPNALEKLLTLSGVIFTQNKKAEEFGYNNYEEQVGVVAQEVQAVLPQVVKPAPFDLDENNQSKSGENYITVQYEKLVPLLIEAIKEQQKQIDELKAKVGN